MSLTYNKKTKKLARIAKNGELLKKMTDNSIDTAKSAFSLDNLGSTVSGLASGVGTIVNASMSNAEVDTTKADNAIDAINAYTPVNTSLSGITSGYNALNFNNDINAEDMTVTTGEGLANMGRAGLSGFTTGMQTGGIWGGIIGGIAGLGASGGAWAAGSAKAKREAERLQNEEERAGLSATNKAINARDEYFDNKYNNFKANLVAYGGPIYKHSGDWSNGVTFINEGGTHEQNPLGGVPVGVDQEGIPNLVEEGEVIWNDYVFSNRLKPTKKQLETIGFDTKYEGSTFAKIVEDVQKASAENPLDKISTDTLNENLMYLMTMQEEIRMKKKNKKTNKFPWGGDLDYVEENIIEESPKDFDFFWGAAKTPEQRLAIMELDPANAYKKPQEKNTNPFVNAGTIAPLISSAGQLIYNTLKPIDKSNVIAAKAYSKVPMMSLPRIGGKKSFTPTDKNRYINPIIAQSNATARALQNSGINASQTLGSLIANNYNTQRAISEALSTIDQADFAKEMQVGQFNLGIDQANLSASQAEQNANILNAKDLARAEIADATTIEGLNALKGQAINASLNNLTKGIADLATQGINWNLIKDNLAYVDAFKHLYGKQAKCGGMLTRKKRRK